MTIDEPTQLFIDVWNRLTSDWSRVTIFRQMSLLGEGAARNAIHTQHLYFVNHRLLNGEYRSILKDPDSFARSGLADQMPERMTKVAVNAFRNTMNASTLIFAHSILDASMYDCVRICALSAPHDWAEIVGKRQVTISEVTTKPYAEVLRDVIAGEVVRLERASLLTKVDRIFQICKPSRSEYLTNGFRFDRDRLGQLDQLRHDVVHGSHDERDFATIEDDLKFMQDSGSHILVMVGLQFGLRFSGEETIRALAVRGKSTL